MKVIQSIFISLAILAGNILMSPIALSDERDTDKVVAVTAHQVVAATTERLVQIITEAKGYFEKDPDRFYREIEEVLGDIVDFDSFSRGVMGKYASKKRYMALGSAEEKRQFKSRMKRFSETFRTGLVQTYAKGLLAFSGNKIEMLPPQQGAADQPSVTVVQHIYGAAEKPHEVRYKLRKNRAGDWKLRNLTIEAINLGKIYQSQFYSAVKQHKGDIDSVIDNWSVDPTADAEKTVES